MSQEPITIVEYDPEWVDAYEAEKRRLRDAVGDRLERIAHIGSTSVPRLAAKPIIDIMGGVETLADADRCIESLQAIGWEYAPEFEESVPQRRYFRKMNAEDHTHHLHVVETGSDWWNRHLRFRDYLRDHPEVAREYETRKRTLAERHRWNVDDYAAAKTAFIRDIEEQARREHERTE